MGHRAEQTFAHLGGWYDSSAAGACRVFHAAFLGRSGASAGFWGVGTPVEIHYVSNMKLCTIDLNGTVLCTLPAPSRGLEKKIPIRMLVQARVTEAVVVVIVPQVGNRRLFFRCLELYRCV